MADFAERLRQLRIQKGNSQQEIADLLNVNKMTISGYERGVRRPAGENAREIYETLADYFNVDTSFLMGLSDVTIRLTNPLNEVQSATSENFSMTADELKLLNSYRSFNSTGKAKLMDYVADLESSPRNYEELLDSCTDSTVKDDTESSGGIA